MKSVQERFESKYIPEPNTGCWLWIGSSARGGYGAFLKNSHQCYAHRVSYELYRGPIPLGLSLDHLCREPSCVNPNHLEAVTHRENMLRGVNKNVLLHRAGVCYNGHKIIGENALISSGIRVRVQCKTCFYALKKAYWQRNKIRLNARRRERRAANNSLWGNPESQQFLGRNQLRACRH